MTDSPNRVPGTDAPQTLVPDAPARAQATMERPPQRRRRMSRRARRDALVFLAFAAPNLVLIAMFTYRPLILNIQYSMLDWTLGSRTATFIGLGNYVEFFTSEEGLTSLRITAIFTLVTVGGAMVLGLLIALALNIDIPGRTLARSAVFAPYVLSGVGVGLVWLFIFDPNFGVLGWILRQFGLGSPQWFLDPDLSLVMVMIVYVWKNLGYCAIVYLGGLQSLPQDVMHAAQLDGASAVRRFFSISLPLLSPTTFFLLITTTLNSLQAFDLLRIMTPTGRGTNTMIFESYLQAFGGYSRAGYSATISVLLFVILIVMTVAQIQFVERKVHYA